ncbi:hypothetical protein [Streptomyces sp. NBC_00859]|uniref:hypothetical protein n=1 Tax=Streptomyces sp. NBC_00859 TaxID=2903682 RepID=UPI00386EF76D|nr:hypothetical protein OG584_11090 [Streptomyces sp. NBC_00859]
MLWEALVSVLLGLALAWCAAQKLPTRLPSRQVVLATGPTGALFGAFLTRSAVGPDHGPLIILGAVVIGAVVLSLLLRPVRRIRRSPAL